MYVEKGRCICCKLVKPSVCFVFNDPTALLPPPHPLPPYTATKLKSSPPLTDTEEFICGKIICGLVDFSSPYTHKQNLTDLIVSKRLIKT